MAWGERLPRPLLAFRRVRGRGLLLPGPATKGRLLSERGIMARFGDLGLWSVPQKLRGMVRPPLRHHARLHSAEGPTFLLTPHLFLPRRPPPLPHRPTTGIRHSEYVSKIIIIVIIMIING